ncbi:MAG: hypothetical protein IJZ50_00215 [Alistipes sp.]|nr:hypothetical protein [Alistipes sp.]
MKRNIFFIVLMSIATLFVACDNSSKDVDKTVDPTVKVVAGEATTESISFTITSTDAESVAYVVVEAKEGMPSSDSILQGEAVEANKEVAITVENLAAETEYLVAVAAEAHDKVVTASVKLTTLKAEEPTPDVEPTVEVKAVEAGENFLKFEVTTANAEEAAYVVYSGDQYDNIEPSELVKSGSAVEVNSTDVYTEDNLESATIYKVKVVAAAGDKFVVETIEMTTLEHKVKEVVFATASSSWGGADHTLTLKSADESIKLVADIYTYNSEYGYLDAGVYTVINSGYSFQEGEIDYYYSSFTADGEKSALDSGTITVAINDDLTYNIVVDVVDALGREIKSEYNGAVEGMVFTNGYKWVAAARNNIEGAADGQFNITFKTAGTEYADYLTVDFYAAADAERLPAGTYTIANSTEVGSVNSATISFITFSNGEPVIDGGEVVVEYDEAADKYSVSFRMEEQDCYRVWECSYDGTIYNMIIEKGGNTLNFVSANGYFSDDSGESYVYLVADNGKQLKLGLIDLAWNKKQVTAGTYTVGSNWAPGEIYSGWYGTDWNDGVGFKEGTAVFAHNSDSTYTVSVDVVLTNDEAYTGEYVGDIEGFSLSSGSAGYDGPELTIESATGSVYSENNMGVKLFTPGSDAYDAGEGQNVAFINIDLYNSTLGLSYVEAGSYVAGGTGAGQMDKAYTKVTYADDTVVTLSEGTSQFVINSDNTYTVTFDLTFANGKNYTGSYTGSITGFTLSDSVTTSEGSLICGGVEYALDNATYRKYSGLNFSVQFFTPGSTPLAAGVGQDIAYINLDLYNVTDGLSCIEAGSYVAGGGQSGQMDKGYTKIVYADDTEAFLTDGTAEFVINADGSYSVSFELAFDDGKSYSGSYNGPLNDWMW